MPQARVSAMLVLPIMGNNKVQSWDGFQWHNIHTKFHQNSSCSFPSEACRQTEKYDIYHTFIYKWWCCSVFIVSITAEGNVT